MDDPFARVNIPLSFLVGAVLGCLWVIRTGLAKSRWAILTVAALMLISPWFFAGWRVIWLLGIGLRGNFLMLGITTAVLLTALVRRPRGECTAQPAV